MSTPLVQSKQLISKQANHGREKPTADSIQKKKKKPLSKTPLEKTIEMDMGDWEAVKIDFGWERHYKQIVLPDCKTLPMGSNGLQWTADSSDPVTLMGVLIFIFIFHLIETL